MKKLNQEQMLELRNQEFLMNMKDMPDITQELKDRLIKNIYALLNHTNDLLERFRIKEVISLLEAIKTKG
tara:strand:+ start:42 stop:251 length:210 start_codon:yes stop_codon:yes gene_type:complete